MVKNVVIIGGASGGANVARALEKNLPETHRIVLIEAKDSIFWQIAGIRAAVVPGFEEKTVVPLNAFFPDGSRHIILPLTKVLRVEPGYILVDTVNYSHGFTERIEYDYAVVATGASYSAPGRLDLRTRNEGIDFLKNMQGQIKNATSVVVVGGGVTGVEFSGEVKAQYPDKQLTIIQSSPYLVPQYPQSLSNSLISQLKAMKATLIFNDRLILPRESMVTGPISKQTLVTQEGAHVEADFLFIATGNKVIEYVISPSDPSAIDTDGYIKTKKTAKGSTLQVDSEKLPNVFVVGDAADVQPKSAFAINFQGPILASNIISLIKSPSSTLKTYNGVPFTAVAVSLGPKGGSLYGLPFVGVLGGWFTSKMKSSTLLVEKFGEIYNQKISGY